MSQDSIVRKQSSSYFKKIEQLKKLIVESDAIIIGAGAGLSTSAGYEYGGERFDKYFSDFKEKYGLTDMYSAGFHQFETSEEKWAYWSRHVMLNRYTGCSNSVYSDLLALVKDKEYFVLTTNVDHCFQNAGFDKERLFYMQGDYGLFQCSGPCCNETFDNEEIILNMVNRQKDMKIPSELMPYCPHCGKPLVMNLRCDDKFVEDSGWHNASKRYSEFLQKHHDDKVLYLELGVGFNTPGIIKYPFWNMVYHNTHSVLVSINYGEAIVASEIENRSICINGDIGDVLTHLKELLIND